MDAFLEVLEKYGPVADEDSFRVLEFDMNLSDLLRSWRLMRRSLTNERDILAARAKLISTLFAQA